MYYISITETDGNKLIYYCRNCGHVDDKLTMDTITVTKTYLNSNEKNFSNIINKYTKLDPTLPRINKIACVNPSCDSNIGKAEREIIYIRYDDINIKYVYLCSVCDTTWKAE
jgi:hypothetical protein